MSYMAGNAEDILQISDVTTTTLTTTHFANLGWRGGYFILYVTTLTGAGATINIEVDGRDFTGTNQAFALLTSSNLAAAGTRVMLIYPGAAAASGGITDSVSFPLPRTFRIVLNKANVATLACKVSFLGII